MLYSAFRQAYGGMRLTASFHAAYGLGKWCAQWRDSLRNGYRQLCFRLHGSLHFFFRAMPDAGYIKFLKGLTSNLLELFSWQIQGHVKVFIHADKVSQCGCSMSCVIRFALFIAIKMKLHSEEII